MPADPDQPPREAVEALAQSALEQFPGYVTFEQQCPSVQRKMRTEHAARLCALRTLPGAARWRLIAWLARGLEPTREMRLVLLDRVAKDWDTGKGIKDALAAASEAGDGE